ncbi:MAG: pitrilysin family protein [Acidimicrobiia bacterium]|nr:MAG: pitrilysin family protein [Acidimicrobiia bacterium]
MPHRLTTLPSGLRVISESMDSVRSVSVGTWVDTGSRDETPVEAGCSHFLEHLLFKGTETLSAREIAEAFDAIGARSNAFTSKEYTCYWAQLRDEDLALGLGLLSEMIQRPAFREEEIASEQHVVLEEINMNEDDPSDVAHDRFARALWDDHVLALPVLGTRESITAMGRDVIAGYWERRYHPTTTVVAAAGNLDHDELVDLVVERFGTWEGGGGGHLLHPPESASRVDVVTRDTEQAHLVLGTRAFTRADERRYAFGLLDHILGGGMSSRLFREVREERGLAYAVYSFRMPYADSGAFGVYVGTTPHQTSQVLDLVREQLAKAAAEGVTLEELERAKGYMKGSMALSLEDTNSRMVRLGRHELTGVEHLTFDEIAARIDSVTLQDVHDVAAEVLSGPLVLGAVGPFDAVDMERHVA